MESIEDYKKIKVISVRGLNATVRSIRFAFVDPEDAKSFTYLPGQFVMISVLGYGESPIAITTSPSELPEFEIAVKTIGNNTTAINRLGEGDIAYIRGSYGKPTDFEQIYGRELVLIAGGMGLAPLRSIIRLVGEDPHTVSKLQIIHGTKSPDLLLFKDDLVKWKGFADVHITVDKADSDWDGEVGLIPAVVKKTTIAKDAIVIVCGPPAMYEPIVKELLKKKVPKENISLMLERKMYCGTGKCQHCTCGEKYVCLDGPTFKYSELENNWEALRK